jgi:hypothetical protein
MEGMTMISGQDLSKKLRANFEKKFEKLESNFDQVLLQLEHRGLKIKESQDLIQRMGKTVLDRAEVIRSQIAANHLTPNWLKEMSVINNDLPSTLANTLERVGMKKKKTSKKKVSMTDQLAATVAGNAVVAEEAAEAVAQKAAKKKTMAKTATIKTASKATSKTAPKAAAKLTVKAFKGKKNSKSGSSAGLSK